MASSQKPNIAFKTLASVGFLLLPLWFLPPQHSHLQLLVLSVDQSPLLPFFPPIAPSLTIPLLATGLCPHPLAPCPTPISTLGDMALVHKANAGSALITPDANLPEIFLNRPPLGVGSLYQHFLQPPGSKSLLKYVVGGYNTTKKIYKRNNTKTAMVKSLFRTNPASPGSRNLMKMQLKSPPGFQSSNLLGWPLTKEKSPKHDPSLAVPQGLSLNRFGRQKKKTLRYHYLTVSGSLALTLNLNIFRDSGFPGLNFCHETLSIDHP